jgi:hypothetical protein
MIKKIEKIFYEITGTRLDNTSQLKMFNLMKDLKENEMFLNIFKSYTLSDIIKNTYFDSYEVENEDWWDNISYKFYGTPYLWWTIALTNHIVNPFEELNVGEQILILKSRYIYQILKEYKNIGEL